MSNMYCCMDQRKNQKKLLVSYKHVISYKCCTCNKLQVMLAQNRTNKVITDAELL